MTDVPDRWPEKGGPMSRPDVEAALDFVEAVDAEALDRMPEQWTPELRLAYFGAQYWLNSYSDLGSARETLAVIERALAAVTEALKMAEDALKMAEESLSST
jgi:hypothetical protein